MRTPVPPKKRRGRPKGSTVPVERDRHGGFTACWWAFTDPKVKLGLGPYEAGYLAALVTSANPIRLEDVEGLVTVASTEIARTASTLDKHIDTLVRKAKRVPPTSSTWLQASVLAIKALIMAMRMGRVDEACFALDGLVMLGWGPDLSCLTARIREAAKSNVPPREDKLGRCGRQLVDLLKRTIAKKT
jgi:hypothetical protein